MGWTMPSRVGSKSGTAPAVAALLAIAALISPTQAFAGPTPLTAPGYAIGGTKLFHQTNNTNIATTKTAPSDKPEKASDDDEYDE